MMIKHNYTPIPVFLLLISLMICQVSKAQGHHNSSVKKITAHRSGNQEQMSIGLYFTLNGADRIADGVTVIYNNDYSAGIDGNDAEQITNFDEDLAISRNGKLLSIEGRPLIDDRDTIFLTIANMKQKDYQLRFNPTNFNSPGFQAYLQDNFSNQEIAISLTNETNIIFSVTSNASSSATNRFKVVYRYSQEYISNGPVNVSSATNWLYYNGTNYINAPVPPANNNITIQPGHSFHVNQNFTIAAGKSFYSEPTSLITIDPNTVFTINGIANFNSQSVTIKSDATGTGSIGNISGILKGSTNVTVERYILALGRRAFRLLGPSVNTATSTKSFIRDNWQEGANNTDLANNVNPLPTYGTHITGSTTGDNGFDATQTGGTSLYKYQYGTPDTYLPIANTNATVLDAKMGYLIFLRGDRTFTNIQAGATSGNTTLRATGTLISGDVVYGLQASPNFTLVTNPYASSINWSTISSDPSNSSLVNSYTYLDPQVGLRGGYVTVTAAGVTSPSEGRGTVNIQSGQAFFVKSTASGTHALTIKEAHKSTTNNVNVFRTGAQEQLSIGLYFNLDGAQRVADGVNILFNNNYSADVDANDAEQITNFDEDISINRGGKYLSIEGRPLVDQFDTIFLNMTHMKQKEYTFEFNPASFNAPGLQAYLQDNFLNSETDIRLTNQTIVPFTVSSTTASNVSNRFRVVFRNITVLPINFSNVKAFEKGKDIQVEWNLGNEQNMKQYEIEKSIDGRTFTKAGMQTARATMSADNYQYVDQQPNIGNNYYRIKAIEKGGTFKYSQVVNVKVGKGNSAITVYPNPVTDNVISLQLINQPKGKYSIRLLNQIGQEVYRKELNHIGGSATETLQLNKKIASGTYNLKISSEANTTIQQVVLN